MAWRQDLPPSNDAAKALISSDQKGGAEYDFD
jgi:hypothetical protein